MTTGRRPTDRGATDSSSLRAAPSDLTGTDPRSGGTVTIAVTGVEHDTVLAFLSSTCVTCQVFWDTLGARRRPALPPPTRLVVVTRGEEAESRAAVARLAPDGYSTVMATEAFDHYAVPGAPWFVVVHGTTGQVDTVGTAANWIEVATVLATPGFGAERHP